MNTQVRWRKSSFSDSGAQCVEASHHLNAIRDSKNPTVAMRSDVSRLLDAVKADSFTR